MGGYFQKAMIELESKSRIEWMKSKSTWMLDILGSTEAAWHFFWISHAWPVSLGAKIGPKSPPRQAVAFVEGSGCFLLFRAGGAKKGPTRQCPGTWRADFLTTCICTLTFVRCGPTILMRTKAIASAPRLMSVLFYVTIIYSCHILWPLLAIQVIQGEIAFYLFSFGIKLPLRLWW